ncbi:MAG: hypothetical protein HY898_29985 [Deltaproteobacteria bacterium]|nr:hypothetical protein [Deltaproteobacteria bacterium]
MKRMKVAAILCVGAVVASCALPPGAGGLQDERGGSAGSAGQDASQTDGLAADTKPDPLPVADGGPEGGTDHDGPETVPDGPSLTLGDAVPDVSMIQLDINCHDGFNGDFSRTLFVVDVVTRTVWRDAQKVTATQAQIEQILAVISATPFHDIPSCISTAVDGSRYPPVLALGNAWTERKFGVSNLACAKTDHDAYGDVMYSVDYDGIHDVIASAFTPAPPPDCT